VAPPLWRRATSEEGREMCATFQRKETKLKKKEKEEKISVEIAAL